MKRLDRILIAAVIICGLTMVALKAGTAPITTDEAWNYNYWISGGFKTILTDYSAFNNHILQTALSRLSINALGDSEFAQRYPSILAYLILAFALIKLLESALNDRVMRLICFSTIILHPYILDFAALARGYMLMIAMSTLSVYCVSRAMAGEKRRLLYMLLASYTAGLAAASIPSALRLLPALLIILLIRPGSKERFVIKPLHALMLLAPALLVVAAFYIPVMRSVRGLSIELGTKSLSTSIQSLRLIFFYTPTAVLDAGGNPLSNPAAISFWTIDPAANWLHAIFAGKTVLFLFTLDLICVLTLPFKLKISGTARTVHLALITILSTMLIERYISGSRLPIGRAWLAVVPLATVTIFALLETLIGMFDKSEQKKVSMLICSFAFALIVFRISSFSVESYWEWPDNYAAPEVVDHIAAAVTPGTTASVSCPNYYHACLTYYANRTGLKGVTFIPDAGAPATYHLFRDDLLEEPVSDGLAIYRYPKTSLVLARDPTTPIYR